MTEFGTRGHTLRPVGMKLQLKKNTRVYGETRVRRVAEDWSL
jgi:hypothetical protein